MKIFGVNRDLTSYKLPLIKIAVSLVLIILHMLHGSIAGRTIDIIVKVVGALISIACFYCFITSIFEIMNISENREKANLPIGKAAGFFHVREGSKSYTPSIIKILICAVYIALFITLKHFIPTGSSGALGAVMIVAMILLIPCGLYLVRSALELTEIYRNRKYGDLETSKDFSVDEIISLLEKNDVIELTIATDSGFAEIGSASDCKPGSSNFFDKAYYIGKDDREFKDIAEFKSAVLPYAKNGKIAVTKIDGLSVYLND